LQVSLYTFYIKYLKYNIIKAIEELIITRGTQIARYFKNQINTHFFSACQRAITLHAEPIGEPAHQIEVQELSPQARAVQAGHTTIAFCLKASRVETIAILYGTLSIKTDKIADHIVIIISKIFSLQAVISTNKSANFSITQLYSKAQTTTKSHAKKKSVA
jgi:anti-sigma28 factor (negative regulator of flagellin synthesis)